MRTSFVVTTLIATLGVVGCTSSSAQKDFSQLESTINSASAGDFGQCMQSMHAGATQLEEARAVLTEAKSRGRILKSKYDKGVQAAQAALRERENAERACNVRTAVLEDNVAALQQGLSALEARLQRTKEVLRGVTFETGSARISQKGQETLRVVANRLLRQPTQVVIEGHTSSTGQLEFNMRLSQQRADAVRNFLVSQGVPAGTITAIGRGPTQPVADNETEEGRRANQRIEIIYEREIE